MSPHEDAVGNVTAPPGPSPLVADLPEALGPWPRTGSTLAAVTFVFDQEPRYLAHHSIRSYFYARQLGQLQGLEPGRDYDDEVMFLGAALHDIGLTDGANGSQRFEVDGADRAAQFVRDQGLGDAAAETVWDAVALHTSPGIVNRKRPEISLPAAGISADLFGRGVELLEPALLTAAHRRYPHEDLGRRLTRRIAAQIETNPGKLVPFTFSAAAVQWVSPSLPLPRLEDMLGHTSAESPDAKPG